MSVFRAQLVLGSKYEERTFSESLCGDEARCLRLSCTLQFPMTRLCTELFPSSLSVRTTIAFKYSMEYYGYWLRPELFQYRVLYDPLLSYQHS